MPTVYCDQCLEPFTRHIKGKVNFCTQLCAGRYYNSPKRKITPDEKFSAAMAHAGGVVPLRFEDVTAEDVALLRRHGLGCGDVRLVAGAGGSRAVR